MTPEQKARRTIDRQLAECGWVLQEMFDMNIMAGIGVAVREFRLANGEADYGLYIDGKVAEVIEAKKEGDTLTGVETQSDKYFKGLPSGVPHYELPLPFGYESTGVITSTLSARLTRNPSQRSVVWHDETKQAAVESRCMRLHTMLPPPDDSPLLSD